MNQNITLKHIILSDTIKVFFGVLILFGVLFVSFFLFRSISFFQDFFEDRYRSFFTFFLFLLQDAALLLPLYFFVIRKYRLKFADFGFRSFPFLSSLGYAFFAFIAFFCIQFTIIIFFFFMGIQDIPGYDQQISYLPVFGNDAFAMIIAFFVIVIIAPIVEELFFRGFLLQTLVQYFHPFLGSFITALVFTSIHFQFQSFIPIFVLSLLLNGLFLHTKNIWPSITFHMLNNVLALILEYVVISS